LIRFWAGIILTLWAGSLSAQTFPALYDVTGVAADDALNVRAAPNAAADILNVLGQDETGVEVIGLSQDRNWAQVNSGEASGWAATRFLTLEKDYPYLPMANLSCFGTEPFWSLRKPQIGRISLDMLGSDASNWRQNISHRAQGRSDRFSAVGIREDGEIIVTLLRESCSDGMSDQMFGIATDVIITGANPMHLSGCCTLQAN
jgi:uncharacterized membrane protein